MRRVFLIGLYTGAVICLIGPRAWERAALTAEPETSVVDAEVENAAELVHSALRLEAEGDAVYREILLGVAVNSYPEFAPAEWHTGHVWTGDKWQTLTEAESAAAADENLAEYARRRNQILNSGNAEDHLRLARWCRKAGLIRQARYELAQVFRGSPTADQRQEAVKWLTSAALRDQPIPGAQKIPEGVERRAAEIVEMAAAWTKWTPVLQQIAQGMQSPDEDKRRAAFDELKQIKDPAAVPVLEATISRLGEPQSAAVVEVLAAMPQHAATMSLARHAIFSPSPLVRSVAILQLERRPLHDYVPWLLSGLESPVKSRLWLETLPNGSFVYMHDFFQEGANSAHIHRSMISAQPIIDNVFTGDAWTYDKPGGPLTHRNHRVFDGVDSSITPPVAVAAELAGEAAANETLVRLHNLRAQQINQRIDAVLTQTTGENQNTDPVRWWNWWQQYNELESPGVKPLLTSYTNTNLTFTVGYNVQHKNSVTPAWAFALRSCFPAGTNVWTETGARRIESIRPGDCVLAQDVDTGELTYKPVLATTLRTPSPLIAVRSGGKEVVATRGHPFWVSGTGWQMAKFLAPGEKLHCAAGFVEIESVEERPPAEAYNLIVEDFATYFVGDQRLLVHDNTMRRPTLAIVPGLEKMK